MNTVCFTGRRPKDLCGYNADSYKTLVSAVLVILENLYQTQGVRRFITGGAQGFDQLAFWAVHNLRKNHPDVENILYLPFRGQESRWLAKGPFSQDEYRLMQSMATSIKYTTENMDTTDYSQVAKALFERNHQMVLASDTVIALYPDDSWHESKGGTSECMRYAAKAKKNIIQIKYDIKDNSVVPKQDEPCPEKAIEATSIKIGITEAGDAGWDLSWYDKMMKTQSLAGVVLITKALWKPEFQQKALALFQSKPVIVHCGITGWGGTNMEPGTKNADETLIALRKFIDSGFPVANIVLRIDPIFPTAEGIQKACDVLKLASHIVPDVTRIRISIYDDYHKARAEIMSRGYRPIDENTKWKNETERRPTDTQANAVASALLRFYPHGQFDVCAEPELEKIYPNNFHWTGCISPTDCQIMNLPVPQDASVNRQNRYGCQCLQVKTELLSKKQRCPNNCAYCYWGQ